MGSGVSGTRLSRNRFESSCKCCRHVVQVFLPAPLCRQLPIELPEISVLDQAKGIAGSQISATPGCRLVLRAPAIFEPDGIDLAALALLCGKPKLFESKQHQPADAHDC